jgi:glycerol-3-phosphate acyltransferase PlsX
MLVQFAVMGALLAAAVHGIDNPRVALLSNGEEAGKGNELTRASSELLSAAPINFIGYCEGNDLFQDHADVIVADGFTGNIAIKTIEGTARFVSGALRHELGSTWLSQVGALLASNALKGLKAILDPRQYGGAPLLGLSAVAIVAHGSADAVAIRSALGVAADCAGRELAEQIGAALSA